MAFSFQDGPGAEPARAPEPIPPRPPPLSPTGREEALSFDAPPSVPLPQREQVSEDGLRISESRTTWGAASFHEIPRKASGPARRLLSGVRLRLTAFDWRRAGAVAALSAWLVVALYRPQDIPLYSIHITNVKLAREIAEMESGIARLSKEKERRLKLLERMEWDPVYWEAMARETGLTREREHVVRSRGKTQ